MRDRLLLLPQWLRPFCSFGEQGLGRGGKVSCLPWSGSRSLPHASQRTQEGSAALGHHSRSPQVFLVDTWWTSRVRAGFSVWSSQGLHPAMLAQSWPWTILHYFSLFPPTCSCGSQHLLLPCSATHRWASLHVSLRRGLSLLCHCSAPTAPIKFMIFVIYPPSPVFRGRGDTPSRFPHHRQQSL